MGIDKLLEDHDRVVKEVRRHVAYLLHHCPLFTELIWTRKHSGQTPCEKVAFEFLLMYDSSFSQGNRSVSGK